MAESSPRQSNNGPGAAVESYLVRSRDALAILGDLTPLHQDLDLHVLSCGLDYDPFVRQLLLDGLTALGLHLVSRPRDEHVGWTVSIQEPQLNFFFTGSSDDGTAVGRAFLEAVEPRGENVFVSQSTRTFGEPQISSVEVSGVDIYAMVEEYYRRSEQKLARYYHQEPRVALIVALPEADNTWIEELRTDEVFNIAEDGDCRLLDRRRIKFSCGCDAAKISGVLARAHGDSSDRLFGKKERAVAVDCPRCAARYSITRDDYRKALDSGSN